LLAKQGLIIFLVGTNSHFKGSLPIYTLSFAINDYLEEYQDLIFLRDLIELEIIRKNPKHLIKSYLFPEIEPFLLPFYERRRDSTSL
jgi:hypothetical protein